MIEAEGSAPMVETSRLELLGESAHDGRALLNAGDEDDRSETSRRRIEFLRVDLPGGRDAAAAPPTLYKAAKQLRYRRPHAAEGVSPARRPAREGRIHPPLGVVASSKGPGRDRRISQPAFLHERARSGHTVWSCPFDGYRRGHGTWLVLYEVDHRRGPTREPRRAAAGSQRRHPLLMSEQPIPRSRRSRQGRGGPPRLALTRSEAAAALGISVDSFERFVQDEVRHIRRGRLRLIPVAELERWLRSPTRSECSRSGCDWGAAASRSHS